MREYEHKREAGRQPPVTETVKVKTKYRAEPKKVEFTKPAMTKTMLARIKLAEKFKQEYERKREETMPLQTRRVPRRTLAPISGDPR